MFVFNKPWKKQAMLINAVSLLSVVFLLLLIEQVNTEGVNIKLDMEGDDVPKASEGGKDALLTDPPTTTAEDTTTKAATSTTPKGSFANAMNGFQNLAGYHDPYDGLTPEEIAKVKKYEKGIIQGTLWVSLIGICCCCVCIVGVVALVIKAVSKKEAHDERETAPKNM
uniref:Uncharacterized protein n=1 Tax=Meloidogyne enterolobii TaxID=390850 RepID=A0A6V7TUE4_MELEN|nr:unnamed protein product [Meloidogyne enterolobii]